MRGRYTGSLLTFQDTWKSIDFSTACPIVRSIGTDERRTCETRSSYIDYLQLALSPLRWFILVPSSSRPSLYQLALFRGLSFSLPLSILTQKCIYTCAKARVYEFTYTHAHTTMDSYMGRIRACIREKLHAHVFVNNV